MKCVVCGEKHKYITGKTCRKPECVKAYKKAYQKTYQKTDKYKAYQKAYYLRKKKGE